MDIIDTLNRVCDVVGRALFGDIPFPDLFGRRQKMVSDAMELGYRDLLNIKRKELEQKDAEIAALAKTLRLAEERLERIRALEIQTMTAPNAGEPVPVNVPPKTNGGRVRAMTDDELAAFLAGVGKRDKKGWRDWLWNDAE